MDTNTKNTRNVRVALNEKTWDEFKVMTQSEGKKTSKVLANLVRQYMEAKD